MRSVSQPRRNKSFVKEVPTCLPTWVFTDAARERQALWGSDRECLARLKNCVLSSVVEYYFMFTNAEHMSICTNNTVFTVFYH